MAPHTSIDPASVDAIVFDIGGVFLIPHHEPIRRALAEEGLVLEPDEDAFHEAHHRGVHAIAASVRAAALEPDEGSVSVWRTYDVAYFNAVGISPDDIPRASDVRQGMRGRVSDVWTQPLRENIAAFHRLAGDRPELRRGIVSNNDGAAEQQMLDHGVCQVGAGPLPSVEVLVDSAIIGVAKPDPAIFDPVLEQFDAPAERILYVGDTYQADVLGAHAAGLQVVQLDPYDLHEDFDHPRASGLDAVHDLLT